MELEIADVLFEEVSGDLQANFTELAKNKSVDFAVGLQASTKSMTTDKQRLEQILKNLLSNAFKFTPANGEGNAHDQECRKECIIQEQEFRHCQRG
ncbi:MAG: hypothetical protein WDN75_06380 [Bacteroidota bacterium]